MKFEQQAISVRDLVKGYTNNDEEGVFAYGGKLNIRPPFQREFIYKDKQRDEVIRTIRKNAPLNTIWWVKNEDNTFSLLDGQQRTMSICEYVKGTFSIDFQYFHNLTLEEQNQILDYSLMVFICEGTEKERLDWFQIINIAGEKLNEQELRNAVYTGPWLIDAKKYFSQTGCVAFNLGERYVKGSAIRQDYLQTVLDWISSGEIEDFMSESQQLPNASTLWRYFNDVIEWVKATFPNYRKEMKGVDWGPLYKEYKKFVFDTKQIETEVKKLMQDEDVTKKSGIYPFILTRNLKYLSIRTFSDNQKREAYERQEGICVKCKQHFEIEEMEGDHITPWVEGGKTVSSNCQMLCKGCNRKKSDH